MRECILVVGLLVLAVALRSCRHFCARKLGALVFLVASFTGAYLLTRNILIGLAGVAAWFFLPWIELLTRIRRLRLPLNNRLRFRVPPPDDFFPNAPEAIEAMDEAGLRARHRQRLGMGRHEAILSHLLEPRGKSHRHRLPL